MRFTGVVAAVLLAGCASTANTSDVAEPSDGTRVQISGANLDSLSGSPSTLIWRVVPAPAMTTWQFLPIAYSRLGLRITRYDSASHVIVGARDASNAAFAGKPLATLMDCGEVAGIPNTSRYDVAIEVTTALRGTEKTSSVASVASASARPTAGSTDTSACSLKANGLADAVAAAIRDALKDGEK